MAKITIINKTIDKKSRTLSLKLKLVNNGETIWLHRPAQNGYITIALFQGEIGTEKFVEADGRNQLPQDVPPGTAVELEVVFRLPLDSDENRKWQLDLVNEGFYWFSLRGSTPAKIEI